jgi:hypothetical protein
MSLLDVLRHRFSRLRVIWADQAYAGDLIAWVWALRPWRKVRLEIVKRPEGLKGFLLLPKRPTMAVTSAAKGATMWSTSRRSRFNSPVKASARLVPAAVHCQ